MRDKKLGSKRDGTGGGGGGGVPTGFHGIRPPNLTASGLNKSASKALFICCSGRRQSFGFASTPNHDVASLSTDRLKKLTCFVNSPCNCQVHEI